MINHLDSSRTAPTMEGRRQLVIMRAIIFPLAVLGLLGKGLYRAALAIVVVVARGATALLLRAIALLLFVTATAVDGVVLLIKRLSVRTPESGQRVDLFWSGLRQQMNRQSLERAAHHALRNSMAWVARKCEMLSPRAALLV